MAGFEVRKSHDIFIHSFIKYILSTEDSEVSKAYQLLPSWSFSSGAGGDEN